MKNGAYVTSAKHKCITHSDGWLDGLLRTPFHTLTDDQKRLVSEHIQYERIWKRIEMRLR